MSSRLVELTIAFRQAASGVVDQIETELTGLQLKANEVFSGMPAAADAAATDAAGSLTEAIRGEQGEIISAAEAVGQQAGEALGDGLVAGADVTGAGTVLADGLNDDLSTKVGNIQLGSAIAKMMNAIKLPLIIAGGALLEGVFDLSPTAANQIVSMGYAVSELLGPVLQGAFEGPLNQLGARLAGTQVGQALITTLGPIFTGAGAALGTFMTSAIALAVTLLPVILLALLIAAIVYVVNNPEIIGQAAEVGGKIIVGVVDAVSKLPGLLLDIFINIMTLLIDTTGLIVAGIVDLILGIPGLLVGLVGLVGDIFVTIATFVVTTITDLVGDIVARILAIPGDILDIVGTVGDIFRDVQANVILTVTQLVSDVVDWFLGIPGKIVSLGGDIVDGIIDGLVSLPGRLADAITSAINGIFPIDIGPIHITSSGITIDPINVNQFQGQELTPEERRVYQTTGQLPERASGGPVIEGEPVIVGEEGREIFVPNTNGTIVPNGALGGNLVVAPGAIVISGVNDPEAVARAVLQALQRERQRQGMSLG